MNSAWRTILIGIAFFLGTCVVATLGYVAAGWNVVDAIYMVVITVFSVGYGEIQPITSPALKFFTMGVIVAGCSSGIYVVGGVISMLAEGEIKRALGSRRMSKGIEELKDHAVICGFGRVGHILAADLAAAKFPFVVIDNSESRVDEAREAGYLAMLGSASEEATLKNAGINRAKVLATVLPDDSANVFITLTAREVNPTIEIIARAEDPSTERKLLRSGATRIVLPAQIGASKIAYMILRPSAEDMLAEATGNKHLNEELKQIGLELTEIELKHHSPLAGEKVANIEVGGGFVLVGIKKPDGEFLRHPPPDYVVSTGDTFVILGHRDVMPNLAQRAKPRQVSFRGAVS
ncbi:MAG TPA: potassium channel protein [Pirellulales bacterium]|jgi:voltage-gated potassium channel|nr:potassium channel protein [Pirellulales bacterium]